MGAADAIRDLLPSLWRPEPAASGLLAGLIGASGAGLDQARIDGGNIMQAHWLRFADYAPIAPFVAAFRREAGDPPLMPGDPAAAAYPYLDDLARLAGLLGLAPFTEPGSARERVEDFRARLRGTVALWRNGVATREAILQAARLSLSGTAERAVAIEEFAPGSPVFAAAATAGQPGGIVGPLMRWTIDSRSVLPAPPEVYVEGVAAEPGKIDATDHPLIERFSPSTGTGAGLLYEGTVAPGQVLALLPSFSSWLGGDAGPRVATALPGTAPANPAAPGPWTAAPGAPSGRVRAMVQGADGAIWVAVENAGAGELWRLAATGWELTIGALPLLHTILPVGNDLLVGHDTGVSRFDPFAGGATLSPDPATATGPAVRALAVAADGTIWAATATGAAVLGPGDALVAIGPGTRVETETALAAVLAEPDGVVHLGGAAGLFRHDAKAGRWHVFHGESLDETVPDWAPWDPATDSLPQDAAVFLPPVTALARGPDTTLWIGTEAGLAQWGAFRIRNTYATRLRAFPALGTGPVHALAIDERQQLWAGAQRGLLVHDGFDWSEEGPAGLSRLARLPAEDAATGWRFDRTASAWQFAEAGGAAGFIAQTPAVVTADNGPVRSILWTDGAVARLGSMADGVFAEDASATAAGLRLRVKPDPTRIAEGGLPALPRLTPGTSHWRYLTEEEPSPPVPTAFPAWTREGRLLPPPGARAAPEEGRFLGAAALAELERVFAFNPAARVSFRWQPRSVLSVTVRLGRPDPAETLPGAVLDRVFEAMNRVRPAGARLRLAFGEELTRGVENG